ncbi:MAG TPA: YlcI/YnfO family protein [Terriglobales bacterium]
MGGQEKAAKIATIYAIKYDIISRMGSVGQFQTTTVRLPKDLYEQARTAVKEAGAASSINDFMVEAVEEKLRQLREQEIDRAFAEMRSDQDYQRDAVDLARSFARSDWEAFRSVNAVDTKHERSRKKSSTKTSPR